MWSSRCCARTDWTRGSTFWSRFFERDSFTQLQFFFFYSLSFPTTLTTTSTTTMMMMMRQEGGGKELAFYLVVDERDSQS